MRYILSLLFYSISVIVYSQKIDTNFVLNTTNSKIFITYKSDSINNSRTIRSSMRVFIKMDELSIEEAIETGIKNGKVIVNLNYNNNCELMEIQPIKLSQNNSFNKLVLKYISEFDSIYKSKNLKQFIINTSYNKCGERQLVFNFSVE